MKKTTKRLTIQRETLRELNNPQLDRVAGGDTIWICTTAPTCEMPTK